MLKFSTIFPIKSNTRIETLIDMVQVWVLGSPHSQLTEGDLLALAEQPEWQYQAGTETFSFIKADTDQYTSAGVRYEKKDSRYRWVTDIIGAKLESDFYVAVQVSCDTGSPAIRIPEPKKPYIIKQLLALAGGGADGDLIVQDTPHYLDSADDNLASSLILGRSGLQLPMVYVSAERDDSPFVDEKKLAHWFSGMAHVVVEPSRAFSSRLMPQVAHHNAHDGAVGIYWPDGAGRKVLLPRAFDYNSFHLEREISRSLRAGLNAVRMPHYCTWGNLKELSARRRIEKLKREGSTEVDSYISAFDEELEAKSEALRSANKEIARLNALLRREEAATGTMSGKSVLVKGREKEFYPNEYRDLLLLTLDKMKNQMSGQTRRKHLLEDIISANAVTGVVEEKTSLVKARMKGYRTMSSDVRCFLEELGFDVTSEGKHYKAVFKGDSRYTICLPKTSSDHRSGKNIASEIVNQLF